MSNWYLTLSDADKTMLRAVLQESAEAAVFNFLCVLDGVSVIEDGPNKGTLQLNYINQSENILISDGQFSSLHDEYNALCQS